MKAINKLQGFLEEKVIAPVGLDTLVPAGGEEDEDGERAAAALEATGPAVLHPASTPRPRFRFFR